MWDILNFQFTEKQIWGQKIVEWAYKLSGQMKLAHHTPSTIDFEKSSCKSQVPKTGFLASKNQFPNWFLKATQAVKIQFEID
jgi:hypothetical protein